MKKIDAKQIVVCYMIDVDKFEMSIEAYKRFTGKLEKILCGAEHEYFIDSKGLKELVNQENSMFERYEDFICLKKQFGRKELYNELNLPYEVLEILSHEKNSFFEDFQENTL